MRARKYAGLAAECGWEILAGTARFAGDTGEPRLEVALNDGGTDVIEADRYLVATRSAPWVPPIEGLTGAAITSVRGEAAARSVSIKTAAGGERELGYGEILVAAGRRPVTAG